MKISPQERAARREAFRQMTPAAKLEHIYTYYKWPIILAVIAVIILCSAIHRMATKKDAVLYTAWVNVAVGADLEAALNEGYLSEAGLDPRKNEIFFYRDLYVSDDPSMENHEFAYASNMKLLATINAQELDLVLMNREAYDILSASGYLMALDGLLPAEYLASNTVILEDNAIDVNLGNADEYIAVTEEAVNAIEVSQLPLFAQAGFDDAVYLAIIGNTPRLPDCMDYVDYLISAARPE